MWFFWNVKNEYLPHDLAHDFYVREKYLQNFFIFFCEINSLKADLHLGSQNKISKMFLFFNFLLQVTVFLKKKLTHF